MSTENLIYLIGFGLIFGTSYLWIKQNKYPKIVSFFRNTYNFFNFKKKILEKEFDLNNKSDELKNFITDPEILENFQNKVCKPIYTHLNPKPTTAEINQYFLGIYMPFQYLYNGLVGLLPNNQIHLSEEKFFHFINNQAIGFSNSLFFEKQNFYDNQVLETIHSLFIYEPIIGFKVIIDEQLELLQKEKVEIVKIYDWLAQNKSFAININPSNGNFNNYYSLLLDYYHSKVQLNQNATLPSLKKENRIKTNPKRLNEILTNGMTEDKLKHIIDQNFEIKSGFYFLKAKKPLEVKKNMFKYFYELLENNNYIPKEPYISKVDRANILSAFFGINIDPTENSRDVTKTDENDFIINYILKINLK